MTVCECHHVVDKCVCGRATEAPAPRPARHPSIAAVLQFFAWGHLPPHLRDVSAPFSGLAEKIADSSSNAETTVALRKLLEAKDAAVRAVLFQEPS